MRLKDKVAIVTASGSGIGKASALLFAREGAKVVVTTRNEEKGKQVVKEITAQGGEAVFVKTDPTDALAVQRMVKETIHRFGRIDILFNNAGYFGLSGTVVDLKEEDWDTMIKLNLKTAYLVSKYVVPEMLKAGRGAIINMASECAFVGAAGESAYCAAKGGIVMLTKAMALDYAAKGIRVNAVAPSNIETPMFAEYINKHTDNPEQLRNEVLKMMPMQRFGRPEEIANVVLFLASDESSYLTGTTIMADSGFTSQ
jgi:NAD(P)-dependent dehydrogenase (short-subunit alcohol dehydrogenase family)